VVELVDTPRLGSESPATLQGQLKFLNYFCPGGGIGRHAPIKIGVTSNASGLTKVLKNVFALVVELVDTPRLRSGSTATLQG